MTPTRILRIMLRMNFAKLTSCATLSMIVGVGFVTTAMPTSTLAQMPAASSTTNTEATSGVTCMEVEVNGQRSPSYSCMTQQLRGSGSKASPQNSPRMNSEEIIQRPSNQLGVYNRAATEHRMGNNFGKSVYPQRPAPAPVASPLLDGR